MTEYRCGVCGEFVGEDENPLTPEMLDHGYCYSCAFWLKHFEQDKTRPEAIVVDGVHYIVGSEDGPGYTPCRGFGGTRFEIEFLDGRETVVSTNLWCQGDIPAGWRKLFPDTARFIPNEG